MSTIAQIASDRIIPVDALRSLIEGSIEHLGARVDMAIRSGTDLLSEEEGPWKRVATFNGRVVVANPDGKFLNLSFESKDGSINFKSSEPIEIPVVSPSNSLKKRVEFGMNTVDALMSESADAISRVLEFSELLDSDPVVHRRNYREEARELVSGGCLWKSVYLEQRKQIKRAVVGELASIRESALPFGKYKALYEGDEVPESEFGNYKQAAEEDLKILFSRVSEFNENLRDVYVPFFESVESILSEQNESGETLSQFCYFAEDLIENITQIESLVQEVLENEKCVMCLGQVYDIVSESLVHYEIAGAFVQSTIRDFVNE